MAENMIEKRERVLQTVRDLILEQGIHNSSMANISKASKVPMGTIYNLFSTKENLINEVYLYCRKVYLEVLDLEGIRTESDFESVFKDSVRKYMRSAIEHSKDYMFVEQYRLNPVIDPAILRETNMILGDFSLQEMMDQGIVPKRPIYLLINMLLGMIHECINLHIKGRYILDDEAMDMIAGICWNMIRA